MFDQIGGIDQRSYGIICLVFILLLCLGGVDWVIKVSHGWCGDDSL